MLVGKVPIVATIDKFEDLETWQLARELCILVYPLTLVPPISKDFRLKDQIRGSCSAIMDNIAEGFGRRTKNEFINSLTIAKGEAEELKSQLYRAMDISYISKEIFHELYNKTDLVVRKIGSFIKYLNSTCYGGQKFKGRN
jgi:four helix bundle protein